eukprot:6206494-Pleurochrysis_carterae.AAC.3
MSAECLVYTKKRMNGRCYLLSRKANNLESPLRPRRRPLLHIWQSAGSPSLAAVVAPRRYIRLRIPLRNAVYLPTKRTNKVSVAS